MRLINTATLEFAEFFNEQTPSYAILSHCWGDSEISYAQYLSGTNHESEGHRKIQQFCRLAREQGLGWAWADTACVDQRSSAELSEAINSMFAWYQQSEVCIVLLPDYSHARDACTSGSNGNRGFAQSRWFTRGWTLQELIAPFNVMFYDVDLVPFGDKECLCDQLASITGIGSDYLRHKRSLGEASVACRMSWASQRTTTRVEDIAYCLLGIFDVNMPLLYGEGRQAFIRLQQVILQRTNDESLFAWTTSPGNGFVAADKAEVRGALARHPHEFARSADIYPVVVGAPRLYAWRYTIKSAHISQHRHCVEIYSGTLSPSQVLLFIAGAPPYPEVAMITLSCCRGDRQHVQIRLKLETSPPRGRLTGHVYTYVRTNSHLLEFSNPHSFYHRTGLYRMRELGARFWSITPDFRDSTFNDVASRTQVFDGRTETGLRVDSGLKPRLPHENRTQFTSTVFLVCNLLFVTIGMPMLAAFVNARYRDAVAVWLILTLGWRFTGSNLIYLVLVLTAVVLTNSRVVTSTSCVRV